MTAQAGSASSLSSGTTPAITRSDLRRVMRAKRAALSSIERTAAARSIVSTIIRKRLLHPGMRVAVYLSIHGEADLAPLIDRARRLRVKLYLPRITRHASCRMVLSRFSDPAGLIRNRLGILEPSPTVPRITPRALDLAFVPLLAFDAHGNRLGMGAGYYDRLFAFLGRSGWRRPKLVGIAYEWQQVPSLATNSWDIPLDAIVTDRQLYRPARR